MKKAALLLVLVIAAVAPAVAPAKDAKKDYAVGSGAYIFSTPFVVPRERTFDFSAIDKGSKKATGFLRQDDARFDLHWVGDVTCLNVLGNLAVFGGVLTTAPFGATGQPFVVWVADNGPPDSGLDGYSSVYLPDPGDVPADFPASCPEPVSPIGYFPVLSGDIVVNDGTVEEDS